MGRYEEFEVQQDRNTIRVTSEDSGPIIMASLLESFAVDNLRAALNEFCDKIAERQRPDRKTYNQNGLEIDAVFFKPFDGRPSVSIDTESGVVSVRLSVLEQIVVDAKHYFEAADD